MMGRNVALRRYRFGQEMHMIIDGPDSVTKAVLSELQRAPDPRFREVMSAFVRHLHDFIREVKLTEEEFQAAVGYINAIGKATNDYHNEGVLMAGSLGVSPLICLINNGNGQTETTANLLGPFWRMESPRTESGGSIVRSPTPGPAMFVNVWVKDIDQKPIAGAEVDVWHSSAEGFYENQDPKQADMNLRGKFTTDTLHSAASSRPAIQSRSTGRPANCCARRGATTCVPRTSTSSSTSRATRPTSRRSMCPTIPISTPTCSSASPRRCSAITSATRTSPRPRPRPT
jgi:hypothetical protein